MPTGVSVTMLYGLSERNQNGFCLVRSFLPSPCFEAPAYTQPHAERGKRLFNKIFVREIVGNATIQQTFAIDDGDHREVVEHPKDPDLVAEVLYAFALEVLRNNNEVNILLNQERNCFRDRRGLEQIIRFSGKATKEMLAPRVVRFDD
jgi:hypothetical protein